MFGCEWAILGQPFVVVLEEFEVLFSKMSFQGRLAGWAPTFLRPFAVLLIIVKETPKFITAIMKLS